AAGQAQCPVLLQPKYHIADRPRYGWQGAAWRSACRAAWNDLKTSPASGFAFVETSGLAFGYKLLRDGFGRARAGRQNPAGKTLPLQIDVGADRPKPPENAADIACSGIALADQIQLAGGALRNLGLTRDFAPWVLFCGHGTSTVNNPYTAALDCGACGGHGGAVNARVAAAILNQPAVRQALVSQGIHIPADTIFLAGWHNTTTDEITLFEADLPRSSREGELTEIKDWLAAAGQSARWERARALHLETMAPSRLLAQFQARARDWSQVRPEWGLAGNAALIAAPRERTQGLNLGGRVFLHDYRTDLDPDKKVLEMILLAPVVVASWINLQYYASTTDNRHFGSGNKVLHNVVGTFGIWQGNGGDLQTGLPLQSLHDGSDWYHEPLRLSVLIEAPRVDLCHLIEAHPALRELVENQWILLFAMEAEGKAIYRYADGRFIGESLTA
ncbi:MAG TPA: putative inorganic carbon transporter subunit DabA, partial [Verrucomicrobiae bacterium]